MPMQATRAPLVRQRRGSPYPRTLKSLSNLIQSEITMSFALAASKVNVALAPASKATVSSKKVTFAAPARSFMVWYVDYRRCRRGIVPRGRLCM